MSQSHSKSDTQAPLPTYHDVALPNAVDMHYVQCGSSDLPVLLLLHGFPSTSRQFRNLIPLLASLGQYRIIAPDLPSFGLTRLPADLEPEQVTFDYLSRSLEQFVDALGIKAFVMYIFDFGAPTGLRLALRRPELVKGIITQNGNAYLDGLGPAWGPLPAWWKTSPGTPEHTRVYDFLLEQQFTLDNAKLEYVRGVPSDKLDLIDPYTWHEDYLFNLSSDQGKRRQRSLFWDYRTNLDLYPAFQEYFRHADVPILAIWGKGDEYFIPAGAEAFKRDGKDVKVVILGGAHFLLETHLGEVYNEIVQWISEVRW